MAENSRETWPREWVAAMAQAYALAGQGVPAPNPHVGCVIVKQGRIVGAGHHAFAGGPHAEVVALNQAGAEAEGADVFVTLEPCAHHGRTPPCVDALVRAKVRRVVIDVSDPSAKAGGGADRLRESGIEVVIRHADPYLNPARIWLHRQLTGRPYVTLKAAITLDGMIARADGTSKWITSEASRKEARRLRGSHGAVLVGAGTVRADDPALTVRDEEIPTPPSRYVLDPRRSLEPSFQIFRDGAAPTHRVVDQRFAQEGDIGLPESGKGLDLNRLMTELARFDAPGLLVEGGATTLTSFLEAGIADEIRLFVAPKTFPGGKPWTTALISAEDWKAVPPSAAIGNQDQVLVWRRQRS